MPSRRNFLKHAATTAACSAFLDTQKLLAELQQAEIPVCTQQYPWGTFYKRSGKSLGDWPALLAEVKQCGFAGFEPIAGSADEVRIIAKHAADEKLTVDSLYVNSTLHDPSQADASIQKVLDIAAAAHEACGTKIIVTNPVPLNWSGQENKSDKQLNIQAKALNQLGEALRKNGQVLAYHNHDAELRAGARELHHMLAGTDANVVKFCLDAHWIFRGCHDSQLAVFDIVRLYGDRIVELHLRQSSGGVWTEAFAEGDIDYSRLADVLVTLDKKPLLVLEQAVEGKTPDTMNAVEAHTHGRRYAQQIFRRLYRS